MLPGAPCGLVDRGAQVAAAATVAVFSVDAFGRYADQAVRGFCYWRLRWFFIVPLGVGCGGCEEVGFVSRVHLFSGDVRSVTTALKVVEEVQEEVQEIEDE